MKNVNNSSVPDQILFMSGTPSDHYEAIDDAFARGDTVHFNGNLILSHMFGTLHYIDMTGKIATIDKDTEGGILQIGALYK